MRQLVVNADDFGICTDTNRAIEKSYRSGILTSASLLPNMAGFDDAVGTVIPGSPGLGVGLHIVLTSGRPVTDPRHLPLLVDSSGLFCRNFAGILALTSGPRAARALAQIERELTAQFEKVRAAGVVLDHVNSHQHVHMIPAIWRVVSRLATRHVGPLVRLAGETDPVRGRSLAGGVKGDLLKRVVLAACARRTRLLTPKRACGGVVVRHPDRLEAAMGPRGMDSHTLAERLSKVSADVTEIVTHPSLASPASASTLAQTMSADDTRFLGLPARRLEFEALVDPQIRSLVGRQGIHLTSFGAVGTANATMRIAQTVSGRSKRTDTSCAERVV